MGSTYPTVLDTFATNKANATATATDHPAHHNDLADAVNKIEAELGVNPSGSAATVVARLATISQADSPGLASRFVAPAGAEDDEFQDDSRAVPGGWTEIVPQATDPGDFVEVGDAVYYKHTAAASGGRIAALLKAHTFSVGDFCEAAVTTYRHAGDPAACLVISDGATYGAGNQVFGFPHSTNIRLDAWTNWNTTGTSGTNPAFTATGGGKVATVFYRVKFEAANTWGLYYSFDGIQWTTVQSNFATTMTPSHWGIAYIHFGPHSPGDFWARWHYFRVNPNYGV